MRAIALTMALTVAAAAAEVPRKAGDIEVTFADGKKLTPADFHGKVLCLTFILTT